VPALDRVLDYTVPEAMASAVGVGTIVRVPLQGRRVRGWVVEVDRSPPPGVRLRAIAKVTGHGPSAELIDLAHWAAWRWAGRALTFLRAASPERAVRTLPPPRRAGVSPAGAGPAPGDGFRQFDGSGPGAGGLGPGAAPFTGSQPAGTQPTGSQPQGSQPTGTQPTGPGRHALAALAREALAGGPRVVRWPAATDPFPLVLEAAGRGQALVLTPSPARAERLGERLRAAGIAAAVPPAGWAAAARGATVVASRSGAWAPAPELAAVVVLDCDDERFQDERAPTWHARDVAVERAVRAGVPCALVSPCPSLVTLALGPLLAPSRADERAGWPPLVVVDRRRDDPRTGLYSPALVNLVRSGASVVAILNRVGRAKLLACSRCGELVRCERCGGGMVAAATGALGCRRCASERPEVCLACGATRLSVLRAGVGRAREELEALAGRPVIEITASGGELPPGPLAPGTIVVGTEAALHRAGRADAVAFLDFDQSLTAPRYRAAEQAMALLVLAARLVGGRRSGGRVLVQTRAPQHEVIDAVLHADPARVTPGEAERRRVLGFPPFRALAALAGPGAAVAAGSLGGRLDVEVLGPQDGTYLVRAADSATLADALAAMRRPLERLRVEVDPLGV
jgi:primosomal protein N' (replication factor Y)